MKVRRVVTGHTSEGKTTVASDTEVDPLAPGVEVYTIWGADSAPTFPDDGSPPPFSTYFPPVGGFRFCVLTIPPQSVTPPEQVMELKRGVIEEKMPGMLAHMETDNPGMHTSDTIDLEYVVSGEVWLELGDGEDVHIRTGDTVVQNGTRHAWRNKGSEPCRMVVCIIGAHRK